MMWPIDGGFGTVVSIVIETPAEVELVAPVEGFFSTAVMVCEPLPSAASGVTDQVPLGWTMAEPMGVVPSLIMTMSPGLPVPVKVGVESSVVPPETTLPVTGPT